MLLVAVVEMDTPFSGGIASSSFSFKLAPQFCLVCVLVLLIALCYLLNRNCIWGVSLNCNY